MADGFTPYGSPVPPSLIGLETGESLGKIPSSLRYRKFFEQYQPTVANSMGMHKLPPVGVRVPISDQYAVGIAHPDLNPNTPDPTIYSTVNGNTALGQSLDSRTAALANLRSRLQTQARGQNVSQIGLIHSDG